MMKQHPFIFSNHRDYRFKRHLAFWLFWWLFQSFLYAFVPNDGNLKLLQILPSSAISSFLYLGSHIFLSYSLMYFVIPRYVVDIKYKAAAVWTLVLIMITASIAAVTTMYIIQPVTRMILPEHLVPRPPSAKIQDNLKFHLAFLAGLRGGLTVGGIAAAIKLMKHWYIQGQKNLELQKENVEAQLQILKAQVHPHFLFNTLNNIYSFTQNTSVEASKTVMGLSDMLRYMLYEGSKPMVSLSKELRMIDEYIELEKIRYGNELELHVNFPRNTKEFLIAPLLLLPFMENCFKHGISNVLENPWLNLDISIERNQMAVKLINSKPPGKKQPHKSGIGLENIRRRLELLYPDKHELTINEEEEFFIVLLKIELQRSGLTNTSKELIHVEPETADHAY
jgi:sensor histidine kinase YesM